jgi:glycosyltransferase involved in cell wall biosynthesis
VTGAIARSSIPYLTSTPWTLARILRDEDCAAVLCQEYEEGRFDLCVALGRLLRIPVYATFQGGDHTRTRVERTVRRTTVRAARGFVIGAASEATRVRDQYGVAADRIAAIANPLDPETVKRQPRASARAALGIDPAARVVVWVGRVDVKPKGLDTLLDAWSAVRESRPGPLLLLMLGTGSGATWLHDRIAELGLDDVRWRDEYVLDRGVVGQYLSAADVFVLPSRQEGFPVAPVEAMAAGLPVVATDAPGVRAVVGEAEDGGGVIVPREDARALANALGRFLDDPALASHVGARAEQRVASHFSLEAIGEQLRSFVVDGNPA